MTEFHEYANLIPDMSGDEYIALVNDIRENGLIEPIALYGGLILDGRHRYKACTELGISPRYNHLELTIDPLSYVISKSTRRNLTSGQWATIAVEARGIKERLEREARERQAHGMTAPGITLVENFPQASNGKTRDKLASMFNTNGRYIDTAEKLKEEAPDLFDQVKAGTLPMYKADRMINRPKFEPPPPPPANKYRIIYADPPWRYEHSKTDSRAIENQYPTMTLEQICLLPIKDVADKDAILFLWTTSPKLEESMQVVNAWGFTYRTCMVWVKDRIGMGYYARQQHEILLIGRRGDMYVPEPSDRQSSVVVAPRSEHSQKPCEFYEIIETMYPHESRIELFARSRREGWEQWGNQV